MSTKLYDGLRLKDSTADLFELIPQLATAIRPAFREAAQELVAQELIAHIDEPSSWIERDPHGIPILTVEERWKEQQQKLGAHSALNDPLRFSLVFGRSSAGSILAYPYYREPRYRRALEELELFEDYHYQNQTDRPEEITEEDWELRAAEWNSLGNSEETFGDLPHWKLGRTMEPFSSLYSKGQRHFDVNSYISADHRLERILTAELIRLAVAELSPSRSIIFTLASEAQRTVAELVRSEAGSEVARPEPLPLSMTFHYRDLPAPYSADPKLLQELLERLITRMGG